MPIENITAKLTGGEPFTVTHDLPENIDKAVEQYGHDVVFSRFRASLVIDLQSFMRSQIKHDKSVDEVQALVDAWVPGTKKAGKSPAEKISDLFGKLTEEERSALLSELAD